MDWFSADEYELARQVLQRGIAACYLIAFVSTITQFPALLGERGLLPVPRLLARIRYRQSPSVFHWRYSDRMLLAICWMCAAIAASLVIGLPQLGQPWLPMISFLVLWAAYLSIVNVGQTFYSFGWESLLVEAGFIVALLGSQEIAAPIVIILFTRWLVSRLEVLGNHLVQLGVPIFPFAPQPLASIAATPFPTTPTRGRVGGSTSSRASRATPCGCRGNSRPTI